LGAATAFKLRISSLNAVHLIAKTLSSQLL
jgi:hypothetical protein